MGKLKGDLDLHKLEIFYRVAELKSFSQAAERLSLRQPTVSAHVQELEDALGGKLLYRIPGKVSLVNFWWRKQEVFWPLNGKRWQQLNNFTARSAASFGLAEAAFPANTFCRQGSVLLSRSIPR